MQKEGIAVYHPLVEDHGVDCVIKKKDGTFIEIQIKADYFECSAHSGRSSAHPERTYAILHNPRLGSSSNHRSECAR